LNIKHLPLPSPLEKIWGLSLWNYEKRITAIFENLICELVPFYNQIIPGNFSGLVITAEFGKLAK
jgi:hypothetical protein